MGPQRRPGLLDVSFAPLGCSVWSATAKGVSGQLRLPVWTFISSLPFALCTARHGTAHQWRQRVFPDDASAPPPLFLLLLQLLLMQRLTV